MNGIPVTIQRNGVEETVYLSTRRSGKAGESMKNHKRAFHHANVNVSKAMNRVVMIMTKAEKVDPATDSYTDALERLSAEQETAVDAAEVLKQEVFGEALHLVRLSLTENHGATDTVEIMDCLTDKQVVQLVTVIETGDTPEDFFPSRAILPKESSISPSGDGPAGSLSEQDTGATPLNAATSA